MTLGEKYGRVEEITMRTTRLITSNNTQIIVPNEIMINQVLVNHSSNGPIRIEVPVRMPSIENPSEIRNAIVDAVRSIQGVMDDPPPDVVIKSLGSADIELLIYAWVANAEQELPFQFKILEVSRPLLHNSETTR